MNHHPLPQRTRPGRRFTRSLVTAGAIALIATSCGADASESASPKIDSDAPATAPAAAPPASTTVESSTTTTTTSEAPIATVPPASTNPEISPTTTTEPSIAGAVFIESTADLSAGRLSSDGLVVGTFEVTEGADVLGCTAGSFVDTEFPTYVRRVMTCESGDRAGTITVHFVLGEDPGPGDLKGPWNVESGTEGFVDLQGEGDFSITFQPNSGTAAETFGGEIRYGPPKQAD